MLSWPRNARKAKIELLVKPMIHRHFGPCQKWRASIAADYQRGGGRRAKCLSRMRIVHRSIEPNISACAANIRRSRGGKYPYHGEFSSLLKLARG